ncbi:MAG TPA: hypothetical protein VNT79_17800, partial [Phycisphaerae bacterium]|nr:hypothetical protein [Phycisphaerae bacterium]
MASPSKSSWKHDPIHGLRGFLVLDAIIRLLVWGGSIFLTLWVVRRLGLWPATTPTGGPALEESTVWWRWTLFSVQFIIWFNVIYAALLILLRLPIPRPHEGRYRITPGAPIAKDLIWSCLIATLTKARYDAPFPAIFVFHAMNLPPLVWIAARVFGPRSKSCYITEPQIIDPHMVTIGRNVVIGFGSIVAGHYQEQEEIVIRRTIIEDDVLIGG